MSYLLLTDNSAGQDEDCEVQVTQYTETVTMGSPYTYDYSLGGTLTGVSPTRGGTGGGTMLTITGTGLDSTAE